MAQLDRVAGYELVGWGFESLRVYTFLYKRVNFSFINPLFGGFLNILLTNDDGYKNELLTGFAASLKFIGHNVTIVAPLVNKSAVAHGVTLHKPISVYPQENNIYAIDGTPVDCIYLALNAIMDKAPDLVISGINNGPNYGDDTVYSGTVAAAREAYMKGVRSISISRLEGDELTDVEVIHIATAVVEKLSEYPLDTYFFNVNIPNVKDLTPKFKFGYISQKRRWDETVSYITTDEEIKYYKIGGKERENRFPSGSDADILSKGIISVTPCNISCTNFNVLTTILE